MEVVGFGSGLKEQHSMGEMRLGEYDVRDSKDVSYQSDVVVEPLERGFGVTIGNSLRRVMLSSLLGAAVTAVEIEGVLHEFSTIPGVREDVTDILLNLKKLSIEMKGGGQGRLTLSAKGAGDVFASSLEAKGDLRVVNGDQFLCSLDRSGRVDMTVYVSSGRGYQSVEQMVGTDARPVGRIYLDAQFSPVRHVSYRVENTRVGQNTQYDKLTMKVVTNGTVTPFEAVESAAMILREQVGVFVSKKEELVQVEKKVSLLQDIDPNLLRKVNELELSVRSANCLKNDNIVYIGDLVQKTEQDMLKTPNFGRKSLNEIRDILGQLNLSFGMKVSSWPPENIEEMVKSLEDQY